MNVKNLAFAALLASLVGIFPSTHTTAHANTGGLSQQKTEDNRQIVAQAFDRWQAGTGNFFQEILSPDVVWTIEGSGPYAGVYRGQAALMERSVRPLTQRLTAPVKPVSKTIWSDGDHVIVHWEGKTTALDGAPYRNRYAWILRMEDGSAVEVTAFLDLESYGDVFKRIPISDKD